ncbi:MAG TPA: NYN domain-containing protein, partial [Gemmatimonadaceae bacterium]|nr:NYN domain-containing protein [Gemmatimonadaceae bacterium]
MNSRHPRLPTRAQSALIHRGPQALSAAPHVSAPIHAPNAALLIDFDNVTMGIRSDLGKELRSLLSSEIIKGKVAVQRAYADWRRYPQYIVPLSEASIDLIFAPAYGSSKKNATDIRLAIDALELVFTRPEIGTFILLSGDSDFSSLVIKLKEYGKYVIGVGIRESSSDLLVQNCDEYYSYNALAGLVKATEEEPTRKYDPWELVTEAVQRMKRNNDVMRSDRLKQVMQDIDSTFDEKNLGISKFSRFCQEAAQRGLLSVTKLDNGQLEVDLPGTAVRTETRAAGLGETRAKAAPAGETEGAAASEERSRRRRGRGRGREREEREPRETREPAVAREAATHETPEAVTVVAEAEAPAAEREAPAAERAPAHDVRPSDEPSIGAAG